MGRRLILDTGVLIAFERGTLIPSRVVAAEDDAAIAAITVTELRVGARLADAGRRAAREASVDRAAEVFHVEPYTETTGDIHAELLVHCRENGTSRGAFDLIIAATAAATGRTILTLDQKADFDSLAGVTAITLAV